MTLPQLCLLWRFHSRGEEAHLYHGQIQHVPLILLLKLHGLLVVLELEHRLAFLAVKNHFVDDTAGATQAS